MTISGEKKDARIEFKTSKEIKELLQNAAASLGLDLSSFLISVATKQAKRVLLEGRILMLNKEEWKRFEQIIQEPPKRNENLKTLLSRKNFDFDKKVPNG